MSFVTWTINILVVYYIYENFSFSYVQLTPILLTTKFTLESRKFHKITKASKSNFFLKIIKLKKLKNTDKRKR